MLKKESLQKYELAILSDWSDLVIHYDHDAAATLDYRNLVGIEHAFKVINLEPLSQPLPDLLRSLRLIASRRLKLLNLRPCTIVIKVDRSKFKTDPGNDE